MRVSTASLLRLLMLVCLSLVSNYISAQSLHVDPAQGCLQHKIAAYSAQAAHKTAVTNRAFTAQMMRYDMRFHHLTVAVETNSLFINGHVLTRAQVVGSQQLDTFAVELANTLIIDSAFVNGQAAVFSQSTTAPEALIMPAQPIAQGAVFEVRIYYQGTPPTTPGSFFGGFFTGDDPDYGVDATWTLSEPYNARNWWPCKQVLADKADSVYVSIITSNVNKAGSNGLLHSTVALPNNKVRYDWRHRYPINYYLVSIAVSRYQEVLNYAKPAALGGDSIPVLHYIYDTPQALSDAQPGIDATPSYIEYLSEIFGLYPFAGEKYGHAQAPLQGGAMEHQTMSTMTNLELNITAHELAHQWFGNQVTCQSFQDIFLNEGFATYTEVLIQQRFTPNFASFYMAQKQMEAMRRPDGSVFVPDTTDDARIFSGRLTYNKGACILHMLRFEVNNDSLFFAALRNYLAAHNHATAVLKDLQNAVEQTVGRSFQVFFDQWYYGEGYPIYDVYWNHDAGLNRLFVEIGHNSSAPFITPIFQTPIELKVIYTNGRDTTIRLSLTDATNFFALDNIAANIAQLELDPNLWLLREINSIERDNLLGISADPLLVPITLGPNPSTGALRFQQLPAGQTLSLSVHNLLGQHFGDYALDTHSFGQAALDLGHLPAGLYALSLISPNGSRTWRWLKQ